MRISRDQHQKVLDLMYDGMTYTKACKTALITRQEIDKDRNEYPDLDALYIRAMEGLSDSMMDETIPIADNEDIDPQRARNMIDARRVHASKTNPKKYGERLDVSHTLQLVNIKDALSKAESRIVLPVSYQTNTIDAQVIDTTKQKQLDIAGCEPLTPIENELDDILR